jgi:hypothetical protein
MSQSTAFGESFQEELRTALQKSIEYCQANDWAGYDPYDALNSPIFKKISFLDSRIPRLIATQLLKRSPMNVRPLLGVPKTQNPKALGLFVSALTKVTAAGIADHGRTIAYLSQRIVELRSRDRRYWCWGYSFPWQTRTVSVDAGTPNLICTAFVADALLDVYEFCGKQQYLTMATSAAEYIVDELYWSDGGSVAGFAYPLPTVRNQVHNANLLAAALLCRVSWHTGERKFLAPALKAARFSASRQDADGSWRYGQGRSQEFIDNFHTGFNLCALHTMMRELRSDEFAENVSKGYRFYRDHFYLKNGSVRYFSNRTYPIDIHALAQSIITPTVLSDIYPSDIELSAAVFLWVKDHMLDAQGYFYYRVLRTGTIRTPYMRWSQAWMVSALAQLLCAVTGSRQGRAPGARPSKFEDAAWSH